MFFAAGGADGPPSDDSSAPVAAKPSGIRRWFTTVDHTDIGLLYLVFGTFAGLWGGIDAMMMRAELLDPGMTLWDLQTYNALFTTHGIMMLFFFAAPVFAGIGNYVIPPLIGADDMAFPRLNAIAFWLLPPALVLVRAGLITEIAGKMIMATLGQSPVMFWPLGGFLDFTQKLLALQPPATGWTIYTPLSIQLPNEQVDLLLLGLHLSGVATTLGAINFITTIFTERGEGVSWSNLDLFSWSMLTQGGLILFAFPLLGSTLIMLLLDRNFGTSFFANPHGGPILYQHLFWFFGHPEVYILVLPAFGLVSLILPKFSGRRLFGFRFVVYSTLGVGVLSFGVWAHHMFATGIDPRIKMGFMVVSIAIAVPSAIKTFNWTTTMWNGSLRLHAPLVFCICGIGLFIIGGVTGVFLASIPYDLVVTDTLYVVGHFHFIIMGIIPFGMFAASFYWFPLITGRMYNRRLAIAQALLLTVGVFVTFFPLLILGGEGLPRRYGAYPAQFAPLQQIASIGAGIIGIAAMLWLYNMLQSARIGTPVEDPDPWNLTETGQYTREWLLLADRLDEDVTFSSQPGPGNTVSGGDGETSGGRHRPSPADVATTVTDRGALILVGVVFLVLGGLIVAGQVFLPLTTFDSATEQLIRTLNRRLLLVAVPIVLIVEALLVYTVWRFRKRETALPTPESPRLEFSWTIATAIILVFVGVVSYGVLVHPDVSPTPQTAATGQNVTNIRIDANQWYYNVGYADANVYNRRADVIYVPANRQVVFHVTSSDVIHSVHIPDLGLKQDAIPGQMNLLQTTVYDTGNYTLYCAEYCGRKHALMNTTVRVVPPDVYRRRVQQLHQRANASQGNDSLQVGVPNPPNASAG
ncbi:MAG: cytochrome c oxidase subunit II [Halorientalis sp.]